MIKEKTNLKKRLKLFLNSEECAQVVLEPSRALNKLLLYWAFH